MTSARRLLAAGLVGVFVLSPVSARAQSGSAAPRDGDLVRKARAAIDADTQGPRRPLVLPDRARQTTAPARDAQAQPPSAPPRGPFWTRTKILVLVGAALVAVWLIEEIKKDCRRQGAACFD